MNSFPDIRLPKFKGVSERTSNAIYIGCACVIGISIGVSIYYINKSIQRTAFNFKQNNKKQKNYFTYDELVATSQPYANTPSETELKNLELLCDNVLNPLREKYGKKIHITSGYRSYLVNLAVGGSSTSEHTKGMAVDIKGYDKSITENKKLYDLILSMNLPYTQLINEHNYSWVHVSYNKNNVKKEKLYAYKDSSGKTHYKSA